MQETETFEFTSFTPIEQVCSFFVVDRVYDVDMLKLADDLRIDPNNLEGDMMRQAQFQLSIGMAAANARADAESEAAEFDIWYAALLKEVKEDNPKATVDGVKAIAQSDEEYRLRTNDVLIAKRNAANLEVAYKAVTARQYMLQSLHASRQREYMDA